MFTLAFFAKFKAHPLFKLLELRESSDALLQASQKDLIDSKHFMMRTRSVRILTEVKRVYDRGLGCDRFVSERKNTEKYIDFMYSHCFETCYWCPPCR